MEKYSYVYDALFRFAFADHVRRATNAYNLSMISKDYDIFDKDTDQSTVYHKMWYNYIDNNGEQFLKYYQIFIKEYIYPMFGEALLYQAKPTIRFHLPGNLSVGEFHKDKWYNHYPEAINVFLPMTKAYGNNTIWCESKEDKGDYSPIEANYGEFVLFDGANLMHGNHINDTGSCRVSFDFRILRKRDYHRSSIRSSITTGKKFIIGDYYAELQI